MVLLFKAKDNRDQDRAELGVCLPLMTEVEKQWLADAVSLMHPEYPWLDLLS